jgi:hypothetical protein
MVKKELVLEANKSYVLGFDSGSEAFTLTEKA